MMLRNSNKKVNPLHLWFPTGYREGGIIRTILMIVLHPAFLIIVAVVIVAIMIFCNIEAWWIGLIASSALLLAVVAILFRRRAKKRPLISSRQAKRCNAFSYVASWLENRYKYRINLTSERTQGDNVTSLLFFSQFVEALVTLEIYENTFRNRIKILTGAEQTLIKPVNFYVDFILDEGIGYVLIMPSVSLIAKLKLIDERVISHTLREVGLVGWAVERINYDDDLVLFVLKNETFSKALDFCKVE